MAGRNERDGMQAILDAALDELDDSDAEDEGEALLKPQCGIFNRHGSSERVVDAVAGNGAASAANRGAGCGLNGNECGSAFTKAENIKKDVRREASAADTAQAFQSMLREFMEADDNGTSDEEIVDQFLKGVIDQSKGNKSNGTKPADTNHGTVDQTLSSLIEEMSKHAGIGTTSMPPDPNMDDDGLDEDEEKAFKTMMDQFQKAMKGEGTREGVTNCDGESSFDTDAMIDGMMEQLMSKDLMYEPMKQVTERFPSWLKENKPKLSKDEYDQRSNQFKCFKKLVHTYETDPENTMKLIELMQQVQEYGQPPQDIVNEIAPGLELDEEGMPKLSPFVDSPFGGDGDECIIQ